jgi:hypothetical protein
VQPAPAQPAGRKRPREDGTASAEAGAPTAADAAQEAYELLSRLLTDPSYGLAAEAAPGAAPRGPDAASLAPGERRLLRLLQRLQPGASPGHARLTRAAAAAQPRLAERMVAALPFDLEPRADAKWVATAAAAGCLVRGAARAPCALRERLTAADGRGGAPGADSAVVRAALRRCLPQAAPKVGVGAAAGQGLLAATHQGWHMARQLRK